MTCHYVYMLRCADGSIHTGHCEDLPRELADHHEARLLEGLAEAQRPAELIFRHAFATGAEARAAERRIKRWRQPRKLALAAGRLSLGELSVPSPPPSDAARDLHWMQQALALAERSERESDEVPVAAILVDGDGHWLADGTNRNIAEHDPSAHAEVVALRAGGRRLGNHRLGGCTLYVTLEPCAMCAMAMIHARLARVVFAAADPKTGACGSVFDLPADPRHNHRLHVHGGVLGEEAGRRLSNYFRRKRGQSSIA